MQRAAQREKAGVRALRLIAVRALLAVAATLATAGAHAESVISGTGSASARIELRVVIPAVLRVAAIAHPATLEVDERDVAMGYVDVEEAAAVRLTSNGRGLDLAVAIDAGLLRRAVVRVLGAVVTADAAGSVDRIAAGRLSDQAVPVSYRLYLDPRVRPGTYRWPVALRFSPELPL